MQPRASLWIIRTSLIYLSVGIVLGSGIFLSKAYPAFAQFWVYLPVHIEFMLFGWILQLFIGTAYWILPRHTSPPVRGAEWKIWGVFIILNLGIIIFAVSSLSFSFNFSLLVSGKIFQAAGVVLFLNLIWPRVRPFLIPPVKNNNHKERQEDTENTKILLE